MIVKVCGLTTRSELTRLPALGPDFVGLIFVRSSPRYVGKLPFETPGSAIRIGVFRDAPTHEILREVERWKLGGVQLHGSETAEQVAALKAEGLIVLKAIGINSEQDFAACSHFAALPPDYFLFDTPGGGTGRAFDWSTLAKYEGDTPFLLAGGIGPGAGSSLAEISHARFAGVDLNSRFELEPGNKDFDTLDKFFRDELQR